MRNGTIIFALTIMASGPALAGEADSSYWGSWAQSDGAVLGNVTVNATAGLSNVAIGTNAMGASNAAAMDVTVIEPHAPSMRPVALPNMTVFASNSGNVSGNITIRSDGPVSNVILSTNAIGAANVASVSSTVGPRVKVSSN